MDLIVAAGAAGLGFPIGALAGYNIREARTLTIGIIGAAIAFALGAGGVAAFHALSPTAGTSHKTSGCTA